MPSKPLTLIVISAVTGILLSACTATPTPQSSRPDNQTQSASPSAAKETVRTFNLTAENFQFNPANITVKQGETVRLLVTATDNTHGLAFTDFGIDQEIPQGQTVPIVFVADKAGTFTFRCSVPCGPGHQDMAGTLTVTPA